MSRPRKDPRAEAARHRVPGGSRPRSTIEVAIATAKAGRPRRDPRAEIAALMVPAMRPRLDRSRAATGAARARDAGAPTGTTAAADFAGARPAAAPAVRTIAAPACFVLVVPDAAHGRAGAHDRQLIGAGRLLADAAGGAVVVLADGGAWGALGADRVVAPAFSEGAAEDDPAARAAAIVDAVRALAPRHVLFAETADGGDLARRVAATLGEPLFTGAESLTPRTVTRPAKAGRVEQRAQPPRLISLLPDVVAPHAGVPHEGLPATLAALAAERADAGGETAGGDEATARPSPAALPRGILSAAVIPADPATVPLSEATFVVSAGNGVSDFDGFHALVAALGATPGASRVVCDAGLMPRDRQVGASGTVLDATCYFALGIAGAPQHLQGVAKCEHVVAVNTDLHAAMIERAGLAVVADAQAVMPALAALLAAERPDIGTATPAMPAVPVPAAPAAAREPPAVTGAATAPLSGRVLLSAGRHPISGRSAPVPTEAQAVALATVLGATVRGLHAGADDTAVADHFGHGLTAIDHVGLADGGDPVPSLVEALAADPPDIVFCGRRGQGGEDGGLVPYRIAAALGMPVVPDAVAFVRHPVDPSLVIVEQALPRGARRRVTVALPVVVTVHPAAPAPRPFAFGPARRGRVTPMAVAAAGHLEPALDIPIEERPWRRRPRLIAGASTGGSAAERLKAATEVAGGGGRLLVDPDPDEAAREILAFLRSIGVLAPLAV